MTIRAKFKLAEVTTRLSMKQNPHTQVWDSIPLNSYKFYVVTGDNEENKKFFASTPSGTIELGIPNPDVKFEIGKEYFVDFVEAK